MMGRAVPLIGEALMLYDALDVAYELTNSFLYDSREEYYRKWRKNVTTIGMYNEFE